MTGVKVAFSAIAAIGGISSVTTGSIIANAPGISPETPINLTLALVAGGITATAVAAWKVSRAWAELEMKLARMEERLASLEKK